MIKPCFTVLKSVVLTQLGLEENHDFDISCKDNKSPTVIQPNTDRIQTSVESYLAKGSIIILSASWR